MLQYLLQMQRKKNKALRVMVLLALVAAKKGRNVKNG